MNIFAILRELFFVRIESLEWGDFESRYDDIYDRKVNHAKTIEWKQAIRKDFELNSIEKFGSIKESGPLVLITSSCTYELRVGGWPQVGC